MATFNLPGDLGTYVRTTPFDSRKKLYTQNGLNNVLGDFVGSVQQNQALYNKVNAAPKPAPSATPSPNIIGGQYVQATNPPIAPVTPKTINPASGAGNILPGIPPAPKVPVAPPAPAQPLYEQFAGSPDIFDISTGKAMTYEEAQAKGNVFGTKQKGYGGGGLSEFVKINTTPRADVKSEDQFKQYGGVDLGGKAKQIEDASGGTAAAGDIMAAVEQDPDVILAREESKRKKDQGASALERAIGRLNLKAEYDKAALKSKSEGILERLYSSLEKRGLAGSSFFQGQPERAIKESTKLGESKIDTFLSLDTLDATAKQLAATENIDISLAKTITRAAQAEVKARIAAQQKEDAAINTFLGKMGLTKNPLTGEIIETAAETRARTRFEERGKTKKTVITTPSGTPITKLLSASQITGLTNAGVDEGLAASITEDILGGVTLEEIRQTLRSHGIDPKVLDTYDKIVSIAGLIAKQPNKVPKTSGSTLTSPGVSGNTSGISNPFKKP
jgi:hypothetical protein